MGYAISTLLLLCWDISSKAKGHNSPVMEQREAGTNSLCLCLQPLALNTQQQGMSHGSLSQGSTSAMSLLLWEVVVVKGNAQTRMHRACGEVLLAVRSTTQWRWSNPLLLVAQWLCSKSCSNHKLLPSSESHKNKSTMCETIQVCTIKCPVGRAE